MNFVSTADTIGGNSGSPVIDRSGAVIGLNFDRNRFGLARDFGYDDRRGRHIAVDVRGITEALRSVYQADALVAELRGREGFGAAVVRGRVAFRARWRSGPLSGPCRSGS